MIFTNLNPEKALVWRIVHRDNVPWILEHGLFAGNSTTRCPNWVSIGNPDLTDKRARRVVPIPPGGVLNDYVPFYFTPFSVMMKNIHSGWGGIKKRRNEEIVILVSSMHHLSAMGLSFIFTDAHAYYQWSNYYSDLTDLNKINWDILQRRDFKRDDNNPAKFERYQAEALIHRHCPVDGLLGMVCYTQELSDNLGLLAQQRGLALKAHARPNWYFE
jgi:hypothetical protein